MNKTELVAGVAKAAELTLKDAAKAVDAVFEVIMQAVSKDDKVVLVGTGTFGTRTRAARTGRNPQTGKEIKIPEATVVYFKAGSKFKDAVSAKKGKK